MSVRCDHCGGRTECDCATCGKTIKTEKLGTYGTKLIVEEQIRGICSVCGGLGTLESPRKNKCRHCGGMTKCSCGNCGKTITKEEEKGSYGRKVKNSMQIRGVCKICGGK